MRTRQQRRVLDRAIDVPTNDEADTGQQQRDGRNGAPGGGPGRGCLHDSSGAPAPRPFFNSTTGCMFLSLLQIVCAGSINRDSLVAHLAGSDRSRFPDRFEQNLPARNIPAGKSRHRPPKTRGARRSTASRVRVRRRSTRSASPLPRRRDPTGCRFRADLRQPGCSH